MFKSGRMRILNFILCLLMLMSLAPLNVLAEEAPAAEESSAPPVGEGIAPPVDATPAENTPPDDEATTDPVGIGLPDGPDSPDNDDTPDEPSDDADETETDEPLTCTCGTDDPDFHAIDCPLYIAPENPQCFCVEKCTSDTLNVWCDICGINGPDACLATGEEEGVTLDDPPTEPTYIITVPSAVDLNNSDGLSVTLSELSHLPEGSSITVNVSSQNGSYLVKGSERIGYSFTPSLSFTQNGSQTLALSLNEADVSGKPSGEYTDVLTFTAEHICASAAD